ncbi:diphthine synthase [Terfezia claveryi]|nr:diphthine synthase [Terfezia claveryi]
MTAVASTGLQLYSFGQTLSMVFFTPEWRPSSWYDRLIENAALGLHTLVLLDIKVKEIDLHALARRGGRRMLDDRYDDSGVGKYGKPRFMTVAECARQMIEIEEEREEGVCGPDTLAVGVARLGTETQRIVSGTLAELAEVDMGEPLHSLVVVGKKCHELEKDYVRDFAVSRENWDRAWENRGYGGL